MGGIVVSNATLHNEEEILRKYIRIGDTVKIRAGDVIPHVISVDLSKGKRLTKFTFPLYCPSCGSKSIKKYNSQTKNTMLSDDAQVKVLNVKKYL